MFGYNRNCLTSRETSRKVVNMFSIQMSYYYHGTRQLSTNDLNLNVDTR